MIGAALRVVIHGFKFVLGITDTERDAPRRPASITYYRTPVRKRRAG